MVLLLIFVLLTAVLSAALFVGAIFVQGYFYTGPTEGIAWRAPAAAALLALFYTLWSALVWASGSATDPVPFDTIFRFSPVVDMSAQPVPKLWAVRSDGTKTLYHRRKGDDLRDEYRDERQLPFNSARVIAYEIPVPSGVMRFDPAGSDEAGYRFFRSPEGWQMQEFESGPTGLPTQSRWGRFLGNLLLNFMHAAVWFACLWLVLQFRFNDSLGIAAICWLAATVFLVPALLDVASASAVASSRPVAASGFGGPWLRHAIACSLIVRERKLVCERDKGAAHEVSGSENRPATWLTHRKGISLAAYFVRGSFIALSLPDHQYPR